MRDRAFRRRQAQKIKKKSYKIAQDWGKTEADERFIGKIASTHGAICSCHMCGNPRKFSKEPTIQELKSLDYLKDSVEELKS